MADRDYRQWVLPYYTALPSVGILLYALPSIPVSARKIILAFTRIRQRVSVDTRFSDRYYNRLRDQYWFNLYQDTGELEQSITLRGIIESLEPFRYDLPIMAFVSTCVRTAPYLDYTSVLETKEETIWKELQAALFPAWNQTLHYEAIFGDHKTRHSTRLAVNLPLNPIVHDQLHNAFHSSKLSLRGQILFPQTSEKTIGNLAQEEGKWIIDDSASCLVSMVETRTLADVERFYHRTGTVCQGVTEVRCAWKYNDLKPRVYYAQGPSCYAASKYIQPVFNIILDFFEVVHRHNRFERPLGSVTSPEDRITIYDYSSFTSSLEEIKRFTRALADFYQGVEVILVDTWTGPRPYDLGQLLHEYTETCNESADFDVTRLLSLDETMILRHTCGMLGVPGNISSCTLLHGLHLVVALGDVYLGRCVGDDALAIVREGAQAEVWWDFVDRVNNLGTVAVEKFEFWDEDDDPDTSGWAYCKRPIARLGGRMLMEDALVWPSIHDLIPLKDQYHTTIPRTDLQISKTVISQWSRLLTRMEALLVDLSDSSRTLLRTFQNQFYRSRRLRNGGYVEVSQGIRLLCPKRLSENEFGSGWKQLTVDYMKRFVGEIRLPRWSGVDDVLGEVEGEVFCAQGTRLLGLLEKLGYLEKELVMDTYDLRSITYDLFVEKLVTLDYPFTYSYTVVRDIPVWAKDVSNLILMSPHERVQYIQYAL